MSVSAGQGGQVGAAGQRLRRRAASAPRTPITSAITPRSRGLLVRARRGEQGVVRRLVAHRRPRVDGVLHDGRPAVLEQLRHRGVRRAGQPELLGVGQPVEDGRSTGARARSSRSRRRTPSRCRASASSSDPKTCSPTVPPSSTSAGMAADLVAGAGPGERALDGAERPGGLAGPRDPAVGRDLRHRLRELRPQRLLQRLQVLAAGLLAAAVVDARGRSGAGARAPWSSPRPRAARRRRSSSGSGARARRAAAPRPPARRRGTRAPCWGPARS